jgi:beta-lactamase class C
MPPFDPTAIVTKAVSDYQTATATPNVAVVLNFQGQQHFYPFPQTSVAENTVFEIGSITKVFTATMLAYNLGIMSLLDPVTKYLPYTFAPNAGLRNITIGQLATHSSGMPNEIPGHPSKELFSGQAPSSALISWWQNFNTPPVKPPAPPAPGSCWAYSNIGFVTLGFAVAGSPNTYNQQLSLNILNQLNMTQTSASVIPGLPVAQGNTGTPKTTTPATGHSADLKSTPTDMGIFLDACINPDSNRILGGLATALRYTNNPFYSGNNCGTTTPITFKQGLAWQISHLTYNGTNYPLIAKDGATGIGGFEAWIGFIPFIMGIVVMGNKFMNVKSNPPQSPAKAGRTILEALLKIPNT